MKAESFSALLVAMVLFSVVLLVYQQWQSQQNVRNVMLYQQQQALQIAENQLALQHAGKNCEAQAVQNGLTFTISCQAHRIQVRFPLGQVEISP